MSSDGVTRRSLLQAGALVGLGGLRLPTPTARGAVRFAAIADVHHGLAPDATERLAAFVEAVGKRSDLDFAIQLGDFCHPTPEPREFLDLWNRIRIPKYHVLGNHDMDRGDKTTIMRLWGMPERHYAFEVRGLRFLVLDLNHFRKAGELVPYAHGNYFTDNATHNWADPDQLLWLASELARSRKPTLVFAHQPLGFGSPGKPLPPEQVEVLEILRRHPVAACVFGHCHVDRLEHYAGIPCYCLNSASYFWRSGMHPYRQALYGFFEVDPSGELKVEGVRGEFAKPPPPNDVVGCSASVSDRRIKLRGVPATADAPARRGDASAPRAPGPSGGGS